MKTAYALSLLSVSVLSAQSIVISEFMYSGKGGEFIEFTNIGATAIDFSGWSYDDDSRLAGVFDLSAFGLVAAGESVVITEDDAATFKSDWSLDAAIKILGGYTNNIGRGDEINLFDSTDTLVDRITYDDRVFTGSPRSKNASAVATDSVLGANDYSGWFLASVGDLQGSYASLNSDIGSPGSHSFSPAVIPEPSSAALLVALGSLVSLASRRRR